MNDHQLAVAAIVAISRAYGAWGADQEALESAAIDAVGAIMALGGDYPEDWPMAIATLKRLGELR